MSTSNAQEQSEREYVEGFLAMHGLPEPGTLYTVELGNDANYKKEAIDPVFQPASAVIHLIPRNGDWMDGQCFDKEGYKVYQD
jgi:hypothetical protein